MEVSGIFEYRSELRSLRFKGFNFLLANAKLDLEFLNLLFHQRELEVADLFLDSRFYEEVGILAEL